MRAAGIRPDKSWRGRFMFKDAVLAGYLPRVITPSTETEWKQYRILRTSSNEMTEEEKAKSILSKGLRDGKKWSCFASAIEYPFAGPMVGAAVAIPSDLLLQPWSSGINNSETIFKNILGSDSCRISIGVLWPTETNDSSDNDLYFKVESTTRRVTLFRSVKGLLEMLESDSSHLTIDGPTFVEGGFFCGVPTVYIRDSNNQYTTATSHIADYFKSVIMKSLSDRHPSYDLTADPISIQHKREIAIRGPVFGIHNLYHPVYQNKEVLEDQFVCTVNPTAESDMLDFPKGFIDPSLKHHKHQPQSTRGSSVYQPTSNVAVDELRSGNAASPPALVSEIASILSSSIPSHEDISDEPEDSDPLPLSEAVSSSVTDILMSSSHSEKRRRKLFKRRKNTSPTTSEISTDPLIVSEGVLLKEKDLSKQDTATSIINNKSYTPSNTLTIDGVASLMSSNVTSISSNDETAGV